MDNKKLLKILGEDIKYYLLMVYIYCHPIYKDVSFKRNNCINEINKIVSKIDSTYKNSKLYIPDEVCTLIGYLITILVLVFVFHFKNVILFILIVLCAGAFIGIGLKKILWIIIKRRKKDDVQKIMDEKNDYLMKISNYKKSLSKIDDILLRVKGKIDNDLKKVNLDLDFDVCFFYILYLYILLSKDSVSLDEALNEISLEVSGLSSLYNPNLDVRKGEKYKDYYVRNIKKVGYGIPDVDKFIDDLPFIKDYQKDIDRAFKEVKYE